MMMVDFDEMKLNCKTSLLINNELLFLSFNKMGNIMRVCLNFHFISKVFKETFIHVSI